MGNVMMTNLIGVLIRFRPNALDFISEMAKITFDNVVLQKENK